MLTFEENGWNFRAIKIYSLLNFFPIEINEETGRIQKQRNKTRVFLWKLGFCLAVLHWIRMFGKLIQSILQPELFSWGHFVVHYVYISGYFSFCLAGYVLFLRNGGENIMIFNQLFIMQSDPVQKMVQEMREMDQNLNDFKIEKVVSEPPKKSPSPIRPLFSFPPQYTVQEHMARTISQGMAQCGIFFLVVIAMDPTRPQLLYSSLPQEYQNWMSYFLLILVDVYTMTFCISNATFSMVVELEFFSKCQLEFQEMSRQLKNLKEEFQSRIGALRRRDLDREIWILQQILKRMEQLVVFIELFNRTFPYCIFPFKLHSLSDSVFGYFFVIRHGAEFPFLAGFCGYIAFVCTTTYTVIYHYAFSIPEKMEELKQEVLVTAQASTSIWTSTNQNRNQNRKNQNQTKENPWPEMKRRIKKIRKAGIRVGGFHTMERESTPKFFDFVTQNVVSLLCTVPR